MGSFEVHTLVLCIIVLVALVAVLSVLLGIIYAQTLRLIRVGAEDDRLKAEYAKSLSNTKKSKTMHILSIVFEVLLWCLIIAILIFTISVTVNSEEKVGDSPQLKTIESSSMATKNEVNTYLVENALDDQISTSDLVFLEKLPSVDEIELYDIIMYKSPTDGRLILHRVVDIYEKDDYGIDERMFFFQGDAVPVPDGDIITYGDMMGIYRGRRVRFVGSFIHFMQSPAGYICFTLAIVIFIATPIMDSRLLKAKRKRLDEIGCENEPIGERVDENKME